MRRAAVPMLVTVVLVMLPAFSASGDQGQEAEAAPPVELERRPGEGEQCIVCGLPMHDVDIVEVRYKGRTFHVGAKMLDEFTDDPELYFQKLQAHSALFDERAMEGRRMSMGWLVFGVYVLAGLVFAALCGYLAVSRGLAPLPWFFAGLLGNVAAAAVLLVSPRGDAADVPAGLAKVPVTHFPLPCSRCGVPNHPAAAACSGCGTDLSPVVEAETARV